MLNTIRSSFAPVLSDIFLAKCDKCIENSQQRGGSRGHKGL